MDKITIGKRIKYERSRLGLTLEEFGKSIGVSKQCLSGWEHGRNMPDVIALNSMSELCGIDIKDFLYAEPTNQPSQPNKTNTFADLTDKEKLLINKVRAMSAERRKALEILLGVRNIK